MSQKGEEAERKIPGAARGCKRRIENQGKVKKESYFEEKKKEQKGIHASWKDSRRTIAFLEKEREHESVG